MKKNFVDRIKLNKFSNAELEQRRLISVLGGYYDNSCYVCSCVCVGNNDPTAAFPVGEHANTATIPPNMN